MSFHWNLSSDEENDFDDWGTNNVALNESSSMSMSMKPSSTAMAHRAGHGDDSSSSSSSSTEEEDTNAGPPDFAGIAFQNDFDGDEDDDEDDNVDWEDAGDMTETPELASDTDARSKSGSGNLPSTLRPVTLDWTSSQRKNDQSPSRTKKTSIKKRVARKRYRFEQLTPDLQYLLFNLERAHLLSLVSHAIYVSQQCSEEESIHHAHSIIPLAWVGAPATTAPTLEDMHSFCNFFFHLVHPGRHQSADMVAPWPRYRRRGQIQTKNELEKKGMVRDETYFSSANRSIVCRTPEYSAFLATSRRENFTGPTAASTSTTASSQHADFNDHDQIHLFMAMVRSLGWRARYVMALEPCRKDLDVDHPLFLTMSTRNVFQRLWKQKNRRCTTVPATMTTSSSFQENDERKRPAKRMKTDSEVDGVCPALDPSSMKHHDSTSTEALFNMMHPSLANQQQTHICWVEILCTTSKRKKRGTPGHRSRFQWVHFDPIRELIDTPETVEMILYASQEGIPFSRAKTKLPISYALAAEHLPGADGSLKLRLSDVTPRYASSFVESLKMRGVVRGKQGPINEKERADKWWVATLKSVNAASHSRMVELEMKGKTQDDAIDIDLDDADDDDDRKPAAVDQHIKEVDEHEEEQLKMSQLNEPIPTSKTAFKTNPVYTLPSLLNSNEVLKPDAKKRVCGFFKGEFVVRRTEVEVALAANRWLYKGRKVKESEIKKPIKRVKKRIIISPSKSFKALKSYGVGYSNDGSQETREKVIDTASQPLDDGMENLYASWQTNAWSPQPVGPDDPLPSNDHNNIELALLNPGLVHIEEPHVAKVAKKLGIPYVPCLLGFEGHRGNRTPTIRGIVVHRHNEELLREAHEEMASFFLQEEHENRERAILLRWKRLLVGVLTKERLERAYG